MTPTSGVHTVFILDLPRIYRPIKEVTAEIKVCGKSTWAEVWDRHKGKPRRYLLGSSAFYSRGAAEKRKLADLRRIAGTGYLRWRGFTDSADRQLAEYEATGTIH